MRLGVEPGAAEDLAHAGGAGSDEDLDELGRGGRQERDAGLGRDRLGEQGLAAAGRARQDHAADDLAADLAQQGAVLDELDHLPGLALGLGEADDVAELDVDLGRVDLLLADVGQTAVLERVKEKHEDQRVDDARRQRDHVEPDDVARDAFLEAGQVPQREKHGGEDDEHEDEVDPVEFPPEFEFSPIHAISLMRAEEARRPATRGS